MRMTTTNTVAFARVNHKQPNCTSSSHRIAEELGVTKSKTSSRAVFREVVIIRWPALRFVDVSVPPNLIQSLSVRLSHSGICRVKFQFIVPIPIEAEAPPFPIIAVHVDFIFEIDEPGWIGRVGRHSKLGPNNWLWHRRGDARVNDGVNRE
jgi:hypothetical protein